MSSHRRPAWARSIEVRVGATKHCMQLLLAANNKVLRILIPRWERTLIVIRALVSQAPCRTFAIPDVREW